MLPINRRVPTNVTVIAVLLGVAVWGVEAGEGHATAGVRRAKSAPPPCGNAAVSMATESPGLVASPVVSAEHWTSGAKTSGANAQVKTIEFMDGPHVASGPPAGWNRDESVRPVSATVGTVSTEALRRSLLASPAQPSTAAERVAAPAASANRSASSLRQRRPLERISDMVSNSGSRNRPSPQLDSPAFGPPDVRLRSWKSLTGSSMGAREGIGARDGESTIRTPAHVPHPSTPTSLTAMLQTSRASKEHGARSGLSAIGQALVAPVRWWKQDNLSPRDEIAEIPATRPTTLRERLQAGESLTPEEIRQYMKRP